MLFQAIHLFMVLFVVPVAIYLSGYNNSFKLILIFLSLISQLIVGLKLVLVHANILVFYPLLFIQEIASHGCFSLGMIARFEPVLHEKGEWMYPRLFWETGILGQVLYLEAHAIGISATGIGCYFDDTGKLSYHFNSSIIVL
jgi:hypothetical protein